MALIGYGVFNEVSRRDISGDVKQQGRDITRVERIVQKSCHDVCRDAVVRRVLRALRARGISIPPEVIQGEINTEEIAQPQSSPTTPLPTEPQKPTAPTGGDGSDSGGVDPPADGGSGGGNTGGGGGGTGGGGSNGGGLGGTIEDTINQVPDPTGTTQQVCIAAEQLAGLCH